MLRRLGTTCAAKRPVYFRVQPAVHVRRNNEESYGRREKTLEDATVKKHEKQLLDDLSKQLAKKNEQLAKVKASGSAGSASSEVEQVRQDFEDQLLQVRHELLGEVRQMDDKVSELKFRIARIERKLS